jgi:hypothetical protein
MLCRNTLLPSLRNTAVYEDNFRIFKLKSFSTNQFDVFSPSASFWFVPSSYIGLVAGFRDWGYLRFSSVTRQISICYLQIYQERVIPNLAYAVMTIFPSYLMLYEFCIWNSTDNVLISYASHFLSSAAIVLSKCVFCIEDRKQVRKACSESNRVF